MEGKATSPEEEEEEGKENEYFEEELDEERSSEEEALGEYKVQPLRLSTAESERSENILFMVSILWHK